MSNAASASPDSKEAAGGAAAGGGQQNEVTSVPDPTVASDTGDDNAVAVPKPSRPTPLEALVLGRLQPPGTCRNSGCAGDDVDPAAAAAAARKAAGAARATADVVARTDLYLDLLKGGDGGEADESNDGIAVIRCTETDAGGEVVAAAADNKTVDAAPNAEKR